ncbi:ankyrin repeat and SOCS box protein 8 isoform X2 [Lethenteron reissneri]|uniref:ankyrin repeat and SOCS box protein 8 isoform X2 n=1 Tax=Lethenteron reissneri TaxID=7753 RepID=UPI002AB64B76|nr:ankyrin repeat and SOCS box protein 8 isoform X2 [Lethenteron reissneri]
MSGTPPLRPGVVAQLQGTGRRSLQERLLRALTGRPSFPPDSVAGLLRQQGADVNVGLGTQLPLHCACMVGNTEGLRLLLQSGAMVDAVDGYKRRALHYAAERSFSDCVALLLAAGAGASPPDGNGDTPLHWAAFRGRAGSARALLRGGACCRVADAHGETPLHWAAKRGRRAIAAALLRHGADPRARNRLGETPVAQLLALMAHRYRNDDDDGDDGDDDDDDDDSGEDEGDERNDQEGCLRLLLAAAGGWVDLPREDQGSQILGRISSCPRLWVRVQSMRSCAPSLANQSRAAVRCALGVRDLRPVVEMLPLPRALQQFLLLRQ